MKRLVRNGREVFLNLKSAFFYFILPFALLTAIWHFLPRQTANVTIDYNDIWIDHDIDAYLNRSERSFGDIIEGVEKRVVWFSKSGQKTPISIIYLHGFTATSKEISPVTEKLATRLGANLYFARLFGHGRPAENMAEASVERWMFDVREAIKICSLIGEKVIIIGTSTGGTLAAVAAVDEVMMKHVCGIIFISPNFAINRPTAGLLTWPLARIWVPLIVGKWQYSKPRNDLHARYWTTRYPTVALMPMAALVDLVNKMDFNQIDIPALFYFSPNDQVVVPEKIVSFAKAWGGQSDLIEVELLPTDDKFSHLITGDIVSPSQTEKTVAQFLSWIKGLD